MMPTKLCPQILASLTASLALAGCGETTSRSEETRFAEAGPASVAECIERFSDGSEVWGDRLVRASFVYDISSVGPGGAELFRKHSPEEGGQHTVTMHNGSSGETALAEFLESEPKGDTEIFGIQGATLIRINDDPSSSFDEALRIGCERVTGDVVVRQVTFSQGKV